MPLDEEAISQQRALLAQHRRRLAVLLQQQARLGDYVPPHVPLEIEDIQSIIGAIKAQLRADKLEAEDEPNDAVVPPMVAGRSQISSQRSVTAVECSTRSKSFG